MHKSVALAKQVEKLETELRALRAQTGDQRDLETSLSDQMERVRSLESELYTQAASLGEMNTAMEMLKLEKSHISKQLERKTIECDELAKSHLARFNQVYNYH